MADDSRTSNVTQQDVMDWLRTAPTDALIKVVTPAIDKIASGPSNYHDQFSRQLSPQARKLFQGEPVG